MKPVSNKKRFRAFRRAFRMALPALLLFASAASLEAAVPATDKTPPAAIVEQRQAVEKASRSRYRDLEVSSLVVILLAGGAAIWWTFRRK